MEVDGLLKGAYNDFHWMIDYFANTCHKAIFLCCKTGHFILSPNCPFSKNITRRKITIGTCCAQRIILINNDITNANKFHCENQNFANPPKNPVLQDAYMHI